MTKIDFDKLTSFAIENGCEYILHGHDHIAVIDEQRGVTRFNPGSTTFPRGSMIGSYGMLEIIEGD